MKIFAHRGASEKAPENTHAAIGLAWSDGAGGVEIDLQLTSDEKIILLHDDSTLRTAGVDLSVEQCAWAELLDLDVGSWKSEDWKGERIPLLVDVLEDIPEDKEVVLDIKAAPGITTLLLQVIGSARIRAEAVTIVGRDLDLLTALKSELPGSLVMWHRSRRYIAGDTRWSSSIDRWIEAVYASGLDGLGLDVRVEIDQKTAEAVHDKGLHIFAWTEDDPAKAERLRQMGIWGVATNCPDRLKL